MEFVNDFLVMYIWTRCLFQYTVVHGRFNRFSGGNGVGDGGVSGVSASNDMVLGAMAVVVMMIVAAV